MVEPRQHEMELTSVPEFTLYPNPASMLLNEQLGNRQTESGPFADFLRGRGTLVEGLKNRLLFLAWYADSRVDHGDENALLIRSGNQTNRPLSREFDRVAQQVVQYLL